MVEQRGWFDGAPGLIHLVLNFSYSGRAGSEAIKYIVRMWAIYRSFDSEYRHQQYAELRESINLKWPKTKNALRKFLLVLWYFSY